VTYPFLGSAVAKLIGPGQSALPPYVWIKPMSGGFIPKDAGFLGPKYGALALGDGKPPENLLRPSSMTADEDAERNELRALADRRYAERRRAENVEATRHVFDTAAQLQKRRDLFDPTTFKPKDVERYGTHDLGRHLLLARRMLEEGVTFVKVTSYGWDTHGDNFNHLRRQLPKLDQAMSALLQDLADRGMDKDVTVVMWGEFGRTPRVNATAGRDHWPHGFTAALAGGGIAGGRVIGETSPDPTLSEKNRLQDLVDPRPLEDLHATILHALGINFTAEHDTPIGRPMKFSEGQPIRELLV
jgi:hypothetical protein